MENRQEFEESITMGLRPCNREFECMKAVISSIVQVQWNWEKTPTALVITPVGLGVEIHIAASGDPSFIWNDQYKGQEQACGIEQGTGQDGRNPKG